MCSEILKTIAETLIYYEIFNQSSRIFPILLLDGHRSFLDLPFLEHINDVAHIWAIMICVPYGTSLWQVEDSKEQNSSYKMALERFKNYR